MRIARGRPVIEFSEGANDHPDVIQQALYESVPVFNNPGSGSGLTPEQVDAWRKTAADEAEALGDVLGMHDGDPPSCHGEVVLNMSVDRLQLALVAVGVGRLAAGADVSDIDQVLRLTDALT